MHGPAVPGDEPDEPDESAMLRYAAGEVDAFDRLYSRHGLAVWRYLLRHVRDSTVADDLLQDVWFAVARARAGYRPTARFKTWLFTMAHNRMVDYWRTLKQHVRMDAEDQRDANDGAAGLADTLAADSGFGPLRQMESREQASALIAAIERLPAGQREAFLLQAEAGMSVDEIAQTTGVAFETAKSRLRYARLALRHLLQEFA